VLSHEIHDAPPSVALLDVAAGERRHFGPPEAAAQEDRQDRAVAEALGRGCVWCIQQLLRLLDGEPIPQTDAFGRDPLYPSDPGGQFRRQQSVVGGLHRELAHRGNTHVDGDGAELAGLQRNTPLAHSCLRESGTGFPAIPFEEFVEPEVVHAAGNRRRDAIQHQSLQSLPMGSMRNNNQISHLDSHNGHYR
jgi:hypothetical protein